MNINTANKKIYDIFKLQDSLNLLIDENIYNNLLSYDWLTAIRAELAEAVIPFQEWKWWADKQTDREVVKDEIIDVWHFVVSLCIFKTYKYTKNNSVVSTNNKTIKQFNNSELDYKDYIEKVFYRNKIVRDVVLEYQDSKLVSDDGVLIEHIFNFNQFISNEIGKPRKLPDKFIKDVIESLLYLSFDCGLNIDEIYMRYVPKNVLNVFRNHNGYKLGTYSKIWEDGKEDNEHLNEIVKSNDIETMNSSYIYNLLNAKYKYIHDLTMTEKDINILRNK